MIILRVSLEAPMEPENSPENIPMDFSNPAYLSSIAEDMLMPEEWGTEVTESLLAYGTEYILGQNAMVVVLKRMLELQLPFEELKKQLTGFVSEREAFLKHAHNNMP
jgi:hypothetical protein